MIHLLWTANKKALASKNYGEFVSATFWQSAFLHTPILTAPLMLFEAVDFGFWFFLQCCGWMLLLAGMRGNSRAILERLLLITGRRLGQAFARIAADTASNTPTQIDRAPAIMEVGNSVGWLAQKDHPRGVPTGYRVRFFQGDLCQNTIIFGGIGSGKTVCGINRYLNELMPHDDYSFLIFDIKGDFGLEARHLAENHHRPLTIVGDDGVGFNLLGGVNPALAASWLKSCFSAAGQGKSGDSFWVDSAVTLCQNALNILQFTRSSYSLFGLYQCIFQSDKMNAAIDEVLADLESLTSRDQAQVAEALEWLKSVWGSNDEKLKQNVLATVSTVLSPFANIDLREGFCTASPDAFQMADLLEKPTTLFVNLPMAKYGKAGASLTYLLIKLSFMNLMRSRRANRNWNQSRPVVFLCDEYQAIVDPISDLDFWDKSRSSKTIGIVSMQGVSSLYAALGNNRPVADAILQNFRNRWLFKSEDLETVQQTVKLLGQHDIELESQSESSGQSYTQNEGGMFSGGWQQTGYSSGINTSVSIQREDILSAAELRSLPKFHALFIGAAGDGESFEDVFDLTPLFVD